MNVKLASAVGALLLVLIIGFAWFGIKHTRDLERRLANATEQAGLLDRKAKDYARERDQALTTAAASKADAELARRKAGEAAAGKISAEESSRVAREETRAAQEESRVAQEKSRVAQEATKRAELEARANRDELAQMRAARDRELDRMHQALARIAAARRTSSGIVIELANDSFYFDFDKAGLRPENREVLSRIAGVLLASNGYRLFIHGHTDDVGSQEYNQDLSQRRAKSVSSYLVSAGIDSDVIETRGFGKSSPRTTGKSAKARQENRRVEIVLVDSIIHYKSAVTRHESR